MHGLYHCNKPNDFSNNAVQGLNLFKSDILKYGHACSISTIVGFTYSTAITIKDDADMVQLWKFK